MAKQKQKPTPTVEQILRRRRDRLETSRGYRSLFVRVAVLAVAGYLFFTEVFLVTQMHGTDMFPSVKDGDLIIAFRMQDEYAKNDVVVYEKNGTRRTGRIIARETDVVTMDDSGTLLVNGTAQSGEILYPTYAKEGIAYPYTVPNGYVFVLGDYRTKATDSRDCGAISLEDVEGKVITILRRRGL